MDAPALNAYKGLNCKTVKGMVAGVQQDILAATSDIKQLDRAVRRSSSLLELC